MYSVVLSASAEEIYASADQALAKKVARCFEQLERVKSSFSTLN
jgi:mRNA interferase RelE/StbE